MPPRASAFGTPCPAITAGHTPTRTPARSLLRRTRLSSCGATAPADSAAPGRLGRSATLEARRARCPWVSRAAPPSLLWRQVYGRRIGRRFSAGAGDNRPRWAEPARQAAPAIAGRAVPRPNDSETRGHCAPSLAILAHPATAVFWRSLRKATTGRALRPGILEPHPPRTACGFLRGDGRAAGGTGDPCPATGPRAAPHLGASGRVRG
jgi:hypothetical protein